MNKEKFLNELETLLTGISEEEKSDALAFYRSYFEDAGEENEASIIAELESPSKVAESIRKNLGLDKNGGYYNTFANRDAEYYRNVNNTMQNINGQKKESKTGNWTGLTVAILVITSPIWLALLMAVAAVLLALVATLFGIAVGVIAIMGALVLTGFVLLGVGIGMLFSGGAAVGVALIGAGLLVLAMGLLAVVLVVWTFGVFLPWAFKGLVKLCKMPFEKRRECM